MADADKQKSENRSVAKRSIDAARKQWQIEQQIKQAQLNRGSQYPPFSIEPMPHERQRLSKLMSREERAARRQWVMDQKLAPNEPRNLNRIAPDQYPFDVKPLNWMRRFYRKPMDILFKGLEPVLGKKFAHYTRRILPKFGIAYVLVASAWYHIKYNRNDWERASGWQVYGSKPRIIGGELLPERETDDFADREFKARKYLHEGKTSRNSELSLLADEPY